jgi:hypothetical protein
MVQGLIPEPGHLFFTEHSERHVLPTLAAGLGIEKSRRDELGRWGIDRRQSNDYVATARLAVISIQREILTAVSEGTGLLDEDDLYEDYKSFMLGRGVTEEAAQEAVECIRLPRLFGGSFGIGQEWPFGNFNGLTEPVTSDTVVLTESEVPMLPPLPETKAIDSKAPFWGTVDSEGTIRRLHRNGGCFVNALTDCCNFQWIETPKGITVSRKCKLCFKGELGLATPAEAEDASSSYSESEDTSSNESAVKSGSEVLPVGD